MDVTKTKIHARSCCRRLSRCKGYSSQCAEDERLSNGVRGQRRVCYCTCSHNASQCNKVGAKPFANHHHVPLSKYSRFSPCALLFLQVPTTVSSAPWHFSWLRHRSLLERLFTRLCGQQDMATRRCVDSVWACHPRTAAAAATAPTPYHCRLHHQLLPPQSFLSCPRSVLSCPLSSRSLFIDCSTGHPFA